MKKISSGVFASIIGIVTIITALISLSVIDSPSQARLKALDSERIADLNYLSSNITMYNTQNSNLPTKLDDIPYLDYRTKDVVNGQPYEYKKIDATTYELCAVFDTVWDDKTDTSNLCCNAESFRHHDKGRYCFTRKAPLHK